MSRCHLEAYLGYFYAMSGHVAGKRCIACLSGDEPSWRYFRLRFLSPHFISCPCPKPFATWPVGHTHARTHTHTRTASANMPQTLSNFRCCKGGGRLRVAWQETCQEIAIFITQNEKSSATAEISQFSCNASRTTTTTTTSKYCCLMMTTKFVQNATNEDQQQQQSNSSSSTLYIFVFPLCYTHDPLIDTGKRLRLALN